MPLIEALLISALCLWLATTALWLVGLVLRDASIIDMFWGPLFVLVAWVLYAHADPASPTRTSGEPLLMLLLVTLWGMRLGFHLWQRNVGKPEDARYRRWRARGGASWWWQSYLRVNCLQAAIAWLVAAPIIGVFHAPEAALLSPFNIAGVLLWCLGLSIEAVADLQLARVAGSVNTSGAKAPLETGVWRFSRHPNYFGDALQWWGLAVIAASPANWWVFVGPIVMTLVFVRVSAPMLERSMTRDRPGYADYVARTPYFLPWFPRRHD